MLGIEFHPISMCNQQLTKKKCILVNRSIVRTRGQPKCHLFPWLLKN